MGWFSDLFGGGQEAEIAGAALDAYALEQRPAWLRQVAEDSWSAVCNLCGGAQAIECPAECGGHAGSWTDCGTCGGGGAISCPVCVCGICENDGTTACLYCPPDGGDCRYCGNEGTMPCPGCAT